METKFTRGDLAQLAKMVGISRQYLSNMLRGHRQPMGDMPERLARSAAMLGYDSSLFDWADPQTSQNPLFESFKRKG